MLGLSEISIGWWIFIIVAAAVWIGWYLQTPKGRAFIAEIDRQEAAARKSMMPEGFPEEHSYISATSRVVIDIPEQRIAIFDVETKWTIVQFSDVMAAELDLGIGTVTTTSGSRSLAGAAIGGLAFGPAGAIVGGLGGSTRSKSTTSKPTKAELTIQIRDFSRPLRRVTFWTHEAEEAKAWLARIQMIIDYNARAAETPTAAITR